MMKEMKARLITEDDIEEIASLQLSPADIIELRGNGVAPIKALVTGARIDGAELYYDIETDEIIGIYGCTEAGIAYMLCSGKLKDYKDCFVKGSYKVIDNWCKTHDVIYNDLWTGHTVAIRWLEGLGFKKWGDVHSGLDPEALDDGGNKIQYQTMFR